MAPHGHTHDHKDKANYMERLDGEERLAWQRPDEVIKTLGLAGDEVVTDLGAGTGFFAFRLALAVPDGRVEAVDVDPDMIAHMKKKQARERLPNLSIVEASPEAPHVATGTSLVLMNNVLHHAENPAPWLAALRARMSAGARLAVLEFKIGELPIGPPDHHKLTREQIFSLLQGAGFTFKEEHPGVSLYQDFYIFTA